MWKRAFLWLVLTVMLLLSDAKDGVSDPGQYVNYGNYAGGSFSSQRDNVLGAFMFYWYDAYTNYHLYSQYGDELTTHPGYDYNSPIPFSYREPGWWEREINHMTHCGIDLVLPDYWGTGVGSDDWSNAGIAVLDQALNDLDAQGKPTPKVGLFYDTSTLKSVDLSSPEGKEQLYDSIRDFYSRLRPDRWARIDHRAIVVLYKTGGIVNVNGDAFRDASDRFAQDFGGVRLYFIGNGAFRKHGVPIGMTFNWGAEAPAHNGVRTDADIPTISPGSRHWNHEHTGNFGQDKLPRNGGDTYRNAWNVVLQNHSNFVFIETWNEFHESSGIAPTREFGNREWDTTRYYAKILHSR